MLEQTPGRRPIGLILRDGGFLSQGQLEQALKEQKHTNELLGEVLVRMGVLESADVNAALYIQGHLDSLEQAVRLAAGTRQMLGGLLIQAGKITAEQLEVAIAEQKKSGEKLGQVLVRLSLLSEWQLDALLAFQLHQTLNEQNTSPLKLGKFAQLKSRRIVALARSVQRTVFSNFSG